MKKNNYLKIFIPFIILSVSIITLVIMKRASLKTFWIAAFFSVVVSFLLNPDKKNFGSNCIKNLCADSTLISCILIFVLAGILSGIIKSSGLSDALLSLFMRIGLNNNFLVAIFFAICCIISTICGTSTGTISFAVPIFIPLSLKCGLNPYLVLGAIASGSFFGDHLSPISDTTIIAANSMKVDMGEFFKRKFKIAGLAFVFSFVIYVFLGFKFAADDVIIGTYNVSLKPLVLIIVPIFMVLYLRMNNDILSSLMLSNILAIVMCLLFGIISLTDLFSSTSCIIGGIESVFGVIVFWVFLYMLIGFLPRNLIDKGIECVMKRIKNPYIINFISCSINSLFILLVSNNTAAMSIQSCFVDKLYKNKSQIDKASIFDGLSCGVAGVLPYNTAFMLMCSLALNNGVNSVNFSPLMVSIFSVGCILFILFYYYIAVINCKKEK